MKKITLALMFAFALSQSFAQDEEKYNDGSGGFKKENLFFGGNFGLSFGNYTQIIVSPQVGYHFNKYFAAGAGINVQYVSQKYYDYNGNDLYKINQGVYGFNLFGRVYPIKQAFIQVQPEFNYVTSKLKFEDGNIPTQKYTNVAPSLLMGVGVGLGGAYISVMYDVIQNKYSPYSNKPFINIGFGF